MKALSFRQPWADLVISGRKTLDLRTWQASYRGPLAVHASKKTDLDACQSLGLDPRSRQGGVVIGFVDLVDIIRLDEEQYRGRQNEHLADRFFPFTDDKPIYGWVLTNPRRLDTPVPTAGHMHLFNVKLDLIESGTPPSRQPEDTPQVESGPAAAAAVDSRRPFELRLTSEVNGSAPGSPGFRLGIYQTVNGSNAVAGSGNKPPVLRQLVELGGTPLAAVVDAVMEALRKNGYQATDLKVGRTEPFNLEETSGVRLGLLFLIVRRVKKMNTVEALSRSIRSMPLEEQYYWFSKCAVTDRSNAKRAQSALRTLLTK